MTIKRAYLDHNATTMLRPEAAAAVMRALAAPGTGLGNASSVHAEGRAARKLVETARGDVKALVNAGDADLVFTSGGTEAAHLAFHAAVAAMGVERLIVCAVEHSAVRAPAEKAGLPLSWLPVDADGVAELEALKDLLAEPGKPLVALMWANNETGVIQPVEEATALVHEAGGLILTDTVQAAGKVPVDFAGSGVDMMLLAGHKLGGPLGTGALVFRDGLSFEALQVGGGQELRRRAGSENLPGIAGFGAAAKAAGEALDGFAALALLRDMLEERIAEIAPDAVFFGQRAARLPNTSYLAAPGLEAERLVMMLDLDGIAVSAGAACSSGKVGHPHVLDAMGVEEELLKSAVRVSLGWSSTEDDVNRFVESWSRAYRKAREGNEARLTTTESATTGSVNGGRTTLAEVES